MKTITIALIAAFAAMTLAFAGLGIKILVRKHGEFKRHCSNMDPYTGKSEGCGCAARNICTEKNRHYNPLEVNKELMEELRIEN